MRSSCLISFVVSRFMGILARPLTKVAARITKIKDWPQFGWSGVVIRLVHTFGAYVWRELHSTSSLACLDAGVSYFLCCTWKRNATKEIGDVCNQAIIKPGSHMPLMFLRRKRRYRLGHFSDE